MNDIRHEVSLSCREDFLTLGLGESWRAHEASPWLLMKVCKNIKKWGKLEALLIVYNLNSY